jgi:hypothetical protein
MQKKVTPNFFDNAQRFIRRPPSLAAVLFHRQMVLTGTAEPLYPLRAPRCFDSTEQDLFREKFGVVR